MDTSSGKTSGVGHERKITRSSSAQFKLKGKNVVRTRLDRKPIGVEVDRDGSKTEMYADGGMIFYSPNGEPYGWVDGRPQRYMTKAPMTRPGKRKTKK
jgi:hypothetical protein